MRILGDFANSQILDATLEYDFFTHIHNGAHSADEVAREAGTNLRATRIVLDSLLAMDLIEKRDGRYYLPPISEAFLVRGKPTSRTSGGPNTSASPTPKRWRRSITCAAPKASSPRWSPAMRWPTP